MPDDRAQGGGRDALSRELRRLRDATGMSGRAAADAAGFSQPKVSRIEQGINIPTPDDVETLARVYRASPAQRQRLVAMARDVRAEHRRVVLVKAPASIQQRIGRIEASSEHVATFSPTVVPGLLQTERYARAVFSQRANRADVDVEKAVAARMARQRLLDDLDHRFTMVMTAGVLGLRAGSAVEMAAQVDRIAADAQRANVRIGIIPWGVETTVFPLHAWDLHDRRVVIVGTATATATLTEPREVAEYVRLFAELERLAVFDDEAGAALARIAEDYRRDAEEPTRRGSGRGRPRRSDTTGR